MEYHLPLATALTSSLRSAHSHVKNLFAQIEHLTTLIRTQQPTFTILNEVL